MSRRLGLWLGARLGARLGESLRWVLVNTVVIKVPLSVHLLSVTLCNCISQPLKHGQLSGNSSANAAEPAAAAALQARHEETTRVVLQMKLRAGVEVPNHFVQKTNWYFFGNGEVTSYSSR